MPTARFNDTVIATSQDTVVVEGNHYFPADSVVREHLVESSHTSHCPWKGTAHYYTVRVGDSESENAAWYYPDASDKAKSIEGRIAFWKGVTVSA